MNYFALLAPAIQIAESIAEAIGELIAGSPGTLVPLPPIRTYLGKLHLEIDISIKTLTP